MKPSTRLDSAVFQLTPTRTRCDLIITANGKAENLTSGLLNPFLTHLRIARDQVSKGGYSIVLEPETGCDATWFTKGTVEKFVRFVSTPEILERVHTIESEILQINEGLATQSNIDVDECSGKASKRLGGTKPVLKANDEKAIVLYTPGLHQLEANKSTTNEGDSKVQLLRVLETRKTVLQKEQGMAFARAVAAGFEIDHIPPLISFSESFGASRLMEACLRFMDLWKRKHETGQWLEIEAARAFPSSPDIPRMDASGIMFANVLNKEEEHCKAMPESYTDQGPKYNDKASASTGEKIPINHHVPLANNQEYLQGQLQQPIFPPWPIHSPPATVPIFQAYPVQRFPYYQNYPGNCSYFQPPYQEDPRNYTGQKIGQSRDSNTEGGESFNENVARVSPHDDLQLDKQNLQCQQPRENDIRSIKKHTGGLVKGQKSLDSESQPDFDSLIDEVEEPADVNPQLKNKNSFRPAKRKGNHTKYVDTDGNQWNTFQNYLLRDADDDKWVKDQNMSREKDIEASAGDGLLVPRETHEGRSPDLHGPLDGSESYRRVQSDDFIIHRREIQSGFRGSSDPLAVYDNESSTTNLDKNLSPGPDESFILPSRSDSMIQRQIDHRAALDMVSELPYKADDPFIREGGIHEPIDLSLLPERGVEKSSVRYDPAFDYKIQGHGDDAAGMAIRNKEVADVKNESNKFVGPNASDKKKLLGEKKGKPSKWSPSDEARARAERLRSFKVDLQKVKKEKEEESIKRLETLKLARQKRIAARSGSMPASSSPSQSSGKPLPLPSKHSPSSKKSLNFRDSEPGLSPIQKASKRDLSFSSNNSPVTSKPRSLNNASHLQRNKLSRSMSSSFPVSKKEDESISPDPKASMVRLRRLSEPRKSSSFHTAPVMSKGKSLDGPEKKKISEIITLDKTKAAILPELKIKTSMGSPVGIQSTSVTTESKKQDNEASSSIAWEHENLKKKDDSVSGHNDMDGNPVIEIKVMTLECEKSYPPSVRASDEIAVLDKDHSLIRSLVSERNNDGFDRESIHHGLPEKASSYQVSTGYVDKEAPNTSMVENSYKAPFARNSSIEEDTCTKKSGYGKAQQNFETSAYTDDSAKAIIPDFKNIKLEKNPEAMEKSQVKEPSKGFKRLLKLGRKDHHTPATVDCSSELNVVSKDSYATAAASSGGSRTFSLLSPLARLAKRS